MSGFGPIKSQYKPLEESVPEEQFMHPDRYNEHMYHGTNPDQFFKDIYNYHQCGGFWAVFLSEFLWMLKFVFVVFVGIELSVCTRWDVLANKTATVTDWDDIFTPPGQCWAHLSLIPALFVTITVFTLIIQFIRAVRRLQRYWTIRQFCSTVLSMPTSSTGLGDMTWVEVQRRLIDSQAVTSLDELNICHRILRHENYLISLVDQDVLPIRFSLPITNPPWPYVFLSDGYLFNLRLILFSTPWSPFATNWRLRSECKDFSKRYQLAEQLGIISRVLGLVNLLFAPVILLAQLLVFLCANAERLRYQPGSIMGRRWSNYAKLYLRHYNELPHQFATRIGMAYHAACQYLDCFISRNLIALAETGAFILGSVSVAFFLMGIIHEQLLHLTGYWAIPVVGGLLARACVTFIPDENVIHSPQALLITILGHIHRVRDHWIEQCGTYRVCTEFSQLFQYRLSAALEEVFSAVVTPFLLIFVVPNHTLEIVDFLRNYTVELPQLGDVCSFAQMDVRRHGDPHWRPETYEDEETETVHQAIPEHDTARINSTEGKIELSLIHFHLNNPTYPLPTSSQAYLLAVRKQLMRDIQQRLVQAQPDLNGQPSGGAVNPVSLSSLLTSLHAGSVTTQQSVIHRGSPFGLPSAQLKKISHLPGPGYIPGNTLGFVGAVAQSMRESMHRSDPGMARSSTSDSTVHKGLSSSTPQDPTTPRPGDDRKSDLSPGVPGTDTNRTALTQSTIQPQPLEQSMMAFAQPGYMADPINMGLMAASALFSGDSLSHPMHRTCVSQTENGSSQHWGVASSIFGYSNSRNYLAEFLTADTSASILYMHELAHRRRQQQYLQQSTGAPPHMSSYSGRPWDSGSGGLPYATSGVAGPNVPYQQLAASSGSASTSSAVSAVNLKPGRSSAGSVVRQSTERSGLAGPSQFGYGSISSTSESENAGVIRTSLDNRRLPRATFAQIAEEDDEQLCTTPRAHPYHSDADGLAVVGRNSPVPNAGVVRVSNAAPSRVQTDPTDSSETEPIHLWPNLPPTNC